MVGDVRRVAEQGTVHVALVLAAGAGVRQAHVGGGVVIVDEPAGRREPVGPEAHVLIILRELEGEDEGSLVDDGVLGISARQDDSLFDLMLQAEGGNDGFESAAAFDPDLIICVAGPLAGLLARVVQGVLREGAGIGAEQGIQVVEVGAAVPEDDRGVFADAAEFGRVAEGGEVARDVSVVGVVAHLHVEHVDAPAVLVRDIGLQVDARELGEVGLHVLQVVLRDMEVFLSEFFGEVEGQGVQSVVDRGALGDALRSVRDGEVDVVVHGRIHRLLQFIHVHALENVGLCGVEHAGGVASDAEVETPEDGILAHVQLVDEQGDERDGAGARGQAVFRLADGADRDAGVGIAGQVVGHLHGDVLDGDVHGVEGVGLHGGDEVAAEGAVGLYAGIAADEGCRQRKESCLHLKVHRKNCSTSRCSCHLPGLFGRREGSGARATCSGP